MAKPDSNARARQSDARPPAPGRTVQTATNSKLRRLARRSTLDDLRPNPTSHAGLWLDRFLYAFNGEQGPQDRAELLQVVSTKIAAPDAYNAHLGRWTAHLDALVENEYARTAMATVDGRMIVGLGAESVLEVGIFLHRTYGVPVIPGSALKGLAAGFAARTLKEEAWRKKIGMSHAALFGTHEAAGCVVFHDALWVPNGPADKLPLDLDVMTVHHAEYYQGKPDPGAAHYDTVPPADWDDPNPVSFITARGTYLIALEGPAAWTDVAMAILKLALRREGIGAKTAAGYGRLDLAYTSEAEAEAVAAEHAAKAAAEQARKAEAAEADRLRHIEQVLRDLEVNNAATLLPQLLALAGEEETDRHALALRCEAKFTRKKVREALKNGKSWVKPLAAILYPSEKTTQS